MIASSSTRRVCPIPARTVLARAAVGTIGRSDHGATVARTPPSLVRRQRARPAVAPPGRRRLGDPGQRGHAAADAGRPGAAGVRRRGWTAGRRPPTWPPTRPARRSGCGAGSATRAGRCGCTSARPRSSSGTAAWCPTDLDAAARAARRRRPTPPGRWPRSRTGSASRSSTPTSAGSSPGRWPGGRRRAHDHGPPTSSRPRPCCRHEPARAARASAAFMELGAMVCVARTPRCTICPLVETVCAWRAAGRPRAGRTRAAARRATPAPTARSAACCWRCCATRPTPVPAATAGRGLARPTSSATAPCAGLLDDGLVDAAARRHLRPPSRLAAGRQHTNGRAARRLRAGPVRSCVAALLGGFGRTEVGRHRVGHRRPASRRR